MTHFTTRDVAKVLEIPEQRVRTCVRAGLVSPQRGPGRRLRFDFQDLLLLRTTKDLLDARVPLKRIRRMLASLRRQLPDDQQLSTITIYADGRRVVAWDGTARWQPDSGQFLFNFDVQDVADRLPASVPPRGAGAPPTLSAEDWSHLASALEGTSPEEARLAYQQVLDLDPGRAEAHINLGRLYHQAREHTRAEAHYRTAAALEPHDPIPHFNLGVLMDDLGRGSAAVASYRRAIDLDPDFADAHYNLGLVYEAIGKRAEAITHLRRARALYGRQVAR